MDVSIVRQRLADAVRDGVTLPAPLPKLQTFGYAPGTIDPPCFYAGEVDIDPNMDFGDDDKVIIVCRVLTSTADDKTGQLILDKLLCRKGLTSVRRALLAAAGGPGEYALGGAADDINVVKIDAYRLYRIGTETFFGAEIRVLAIGDGEVD